MYELPEEKIARYPLSKRDESKLLVYKDGEISESIYKNLADFLPENSLLVRNVSKVLPARILIDGCELFLTKPIGMDYEQALLQTSSVVWNCLVRGLKEGSYNLENIEITLSKPKLKEDREWVAEITWEAPSSFVGRGQGDGLSFSEILNKFGSMPLPPYMKRVEEVEDKDRYQTIFAKEIGSIASPTASLHMTHEVLMSLKQKNIEIVDVVLHVGLGTFLPMKTDLENHIMHAEYFEISNETLSKLISAISEERKIIALGTTAFRTIESLSWLPYCFDSAKEYQKVPQWVWKDQNWNKQEFLDFMNSNSGEGNGICGETAIMCTPKYQTNIVDVLLTNFHQPESTLIQLVSGFVKGDWKQIYQYALDHDFRFLSYGDTSLLWKNTNKY